MAYPPIAVQAQAVLDFWFGPADAPGHGQPRPLWFKKDPGFDVTVAQRFGPLIEQALQDGLAAWWRPLPTPPSTPLQALAAVIVLDQFTRNTGRRDGEPTAAAFAGDAMALAIAQAVVDAKLDSGLTGVQRQFLYLPFEHAENLAMQRRAVALFTQLAQDEPARADLVGWARRHLDIVARFGRFPHRNAALGRASTAEEQAFLQTPGSGF